MALSRSAVRQDGIALPLPPFDLRQRVGATTCPEIAVVERQLRKASWWDPDPAEAWLRQGRFLAGLLRDHLPEDFSLSGARVLDFGCGAGRVMRHLVEDVGDGEVHGVDIDRPSIAWIQANASPPLHAAACDEEPGLPYPDGHFDFVYVFSVFTHIVEHWAGWLLELRRVLAPGGLLIASVIGRRTGEELRIGPPADAPEGGYVVALGNPWDAGGPVAIHDTSWIAEHWGRAFEIEAHVPRATGTPWPHDLVVGRPRAGVVTEDELLAPGLDGRRDGMAQRAQLELLRRDSLARRVDYEGKTREAADVAAAARDRIAHEAPARFAELETRRAELEQARAGASNGSPITRHARALARRARAAGDGG